TELYAMQVRLRTFEQRAHQIYIDGLIKGTSHLGTGQEAIDDLSGPIVRITTPHLPCPRRKTSRASRYLRPRASRKRSSRTYGERLLYPTLVKEPAHA
ncbi:MAG: hypothetical protein M3301_05190, partial [Chloroflexota bacterium]|nr:hypothetical protein [Chloroflexota bacterium]